MRWGASTLAISAPQQWERRARSAGLQAQAAWRRPPATWDGGLAAVVLFPFIAEAG
jgi:hypothetical protein